MKSRSLATMCASIVTASHVLASCSSTGTGDQPDLEILTEALACSAAAGAGGERHLFPHAVVPVSSVLETIVFGSTDPGNLEPINFELGFKFAGSTNNVAITAPGDLYVTSLKTTEYISGWRAGEKDYGFTFHVCSEDDEPAVEGELAHITGLSAQVNALFDGSGFSCQMNSGADETSESCSKRYELGVDETVLIAGGSAVGTAGGSGATAYHPGLDFNLIDRRFENMFVNRDRLGGEEGPGASFRYGACLYEYFSEPTRTSYLDLIGQNGVFRESVASPCGALSVDVANTAAGVWIKSSAADLDFADDHVEVLSNLLVLKDHPLEPDTFQVLSTEMTDIASHLGEAELVEFKKEGTGDVNRSFEDITPHASGGTDPIHCLRGEGFDATGVQFYFYVQVTNGGSTLKLERLGADCNSTPLASRAFSGAEVVFVR